MKPLQVHTQFFKLFKEAFISSHYKFVYLKVYFIASDSCTYINKSQTMISDSFLILTYITSAIFFRLAFVLSGVSVSKTGRSSGETQSSL